MTQNFVFLKNSGTGQCMDEWVNVVAVLGLEKFDICKGSLQRILKVDIHTYIQTDNEIKRQTDW